MKPPPKYNTLKQTLLQLLSMLFRLFLCLFRFLFYFCLISCHCCCCCICSGCRWYAINSCWNITLEIHGNLSWGLFFDLKLLCCKAGGRAAYVRNRSAGKFFEERWARMKEENNKNGRLVSCSCLTLVLSFIWLLFFAYLKLILRWVDHPARGMSI